MSRDQSLSKACSTTARRTEQNKPKQQGLHPVPDRYIIHRKMIGAATRLSTLTAVRMSRSPPQPQKRGIINFLTNYPDKVMETKKIQMAGGTRLMEKNPTWMKQSGDSMVLVIGAGLVGFGAIQCISGYWKLATGKGKYA